MNGKCPAKTRAGLAAAVCLSAWLAPAWVSADFDDLNQPLRIEQQKSRFQLMLEQVQERARQRAATRSASLEQARSADPVGLGDWSESLRLDSMAVTEPAPLGLDPQPERRLRAEHAYERRQRQTLDQRQQRDALIVGAGVRDPADSYATKRRSLVRFKSQDARLNLQRKLLR